MLPDRGSETEAHKNNYRATVKEGTAGLVKMSGMQNAEPYVCDY